VSVDSVVVGQGVWEGKLRAGGHRIEVAAAGFRPARQDVTLAKADREQRTVTLERDESSPLWKRSHPARVFVGADFGPRSGSRTAATFAMRAAAPAPPTSRSASPSPHVAATSSRAGSRSASTSAISSRAPA